MKPIVGITGSTGKTTTREIISKIFSTQWKTFQNYKNGNDAFFIEKYKEQINETHEAVVLEYALIFANDIANCCRIIQPNVGIITNIGSAHIANFDYKMENLIKEKGELARNIKKRWDFITKR